jgi:hypothetical protein
MKFLLILLLLPIGKCFASSYISPTRTLTDGGTQFDFFTKYFKSKSYINENGEGFSFIGNENYQQLDMGLNLNYGITNQFEILVGVRGRYITALTTVANEEYALSRAGLESGIVGFKYSFKEDDGVQYALEGSYRQALYSNTLYTSGEPTDIALGDDSRELSAGFSMGIETKSKNALAARVLYRDPSKNLSTEIFSEVEYNLVWESFSMGLGVENVYSLQNDEFSNNPESKPQVSRGPSYMHNSVNRQWTAPYLKSALALGKTWRVEFQYSTVYTGNSTDKRDMMLFNLVRRNDKKVNSFKVIDNSFKQYTIEGVVTKVATSRKTFMIDRGLERGLKTGMRVDFYHFDYVGGNALIATGVAVKVGGTKSLIKLNKRYSKKRVEVGTVVRAGILVSSD